MVDHVDANGGVGRWVPARSVRPDVEALRTHEIALPQALVAQLFERAAAGGVKPVTVLIAALAVTLCKCSHETSVVIGKFGSAVEGGGTEVSLMRAFTERFTSLHETCEAIEDFFEEHPSFDATRFGTMVERLLPAFDEAYFPLFQIGVSETRRTTIEEDFARIEGFRYHQRQLDLTVLLSVSEPASFLAFRYVTTALSEDLVIGIADALIALLRRALDDPASPLTSHPALTEAEYQRLVVGYNRTDETLPTDGTIHGSVLSAAAEHGSKLAVICGDRSITYDELARSVRGFAAVLVEQGVRPGDIVPVCLERSIELIVSVLATMSAGAAYLPITPDTPPSRAAFMVADCGARTVIARNLPFDVPAGCTAVDPTEQPRTRLSDRDPVGASDLAYVIYTSGSTGRPKGVMIEHRSALNRLRWMERKYAFTDADRLLQKTPIDFDVSVVELFLPLVTGATLVFADPGDHRDPVQIQRLIQRHGITWIHFVPSMLDVFLASFGQSERLAIPRTFCSGEALSAATVARFFRHIDGDLHNLYGPTEAAVDVTSFQCAPAHPVVPIGRPVSNTQTYIVDPFGQPVPDLIPGELWLGGVQIARGYLNRPELTAERFIDDYFRSEGRLYKTGDLARWNAHGEIEYLGRMDTQVKIAGVRVETTEIEYQLTLFGDIAQAVVLPTTLDDARVALAAYYVSDHLIPDHELRRRLAVSLPPAMIPSFFVKVGALPTTANGKLDRPRLPLPAHNRAPTGDAVHESGSLAATLLDCWRSVLSVAGIGLDSDFLELGGTSLQAAEIVARFYRQLRLHVRPDELLRHRTVRALLGAIDPSKHSDAPQFVGQRSNAPLSTAQEPIWHHQLRLHGSALYNEQFAVIVDQELDTSVLQRAVISVVTQHAAYNTTIAREGDSIVQTIGGLPPFSVPIVQASERPDRADFWKAPAAKLVSTPFDLNGERLVRASIFALEEKKTILLLVISHLVTDGVAVYNLLVPEIFAAYQALAEKRTVPSATTDTSYFAYAAWTQQARVDQEKLSYWTRRLEGRSTTTIGGSSVNIGERYDPVGGQVVVDFPDDTSVRVRELAKSVGVTPFLILLSCFGVALQMFSQSKDISFGTVTSGRGIPETARVHGLFMNTVPVLMEFDEVLSFRDVLLRTHDSVLDGLANEVPYSQLLRAAGRTFQNPLVNILFALEPSPAADGFWRIDQTLLHPGAVKYDLTLELSEAGDLLQGRAEYRMSVLGEEFVRNFCRCFTSVLRAVTDNVDIRLAALGYGVPAAPIVGQGDVASSEAALLEPCFMSLQRWARATPSAVAVCDPNGSLTFSDLEVASNRLARYLQALGVGGGALVGLYLRPGNDILVALLAVQKSGAAYVPLDPSYPAARTATILEAATARLVITTTDLLGSLPNLAKPLCLDDPRVQAAQAALDPTPPIHNPAVLLDGPAYVIFTSGSTGRPKGVVISHRALTHYASWAQQYYGLSRLAGAVVVTSIGFDATVTSLYCPLLAGRTVFFPAMFEGGIPDISAWLFSDEDYLVKLTPAHLSFYATSYGDRAHSIRQHVFVVGGEQLTVSCLSRFGRLSPRATYVNEYGPTETTVGCCVFETSSVGTITGSVVPIGRPIARTQLSVVDSEGRLVPRGVAGHLLIGGAGLALGYFQRPDLTTEAFANTNGDLVYCTGDIVRELPDGNLEYVGRRDGQVKIRGHRVELGEIEATLSLASGVRDVVAVLVGDDAEGRVLVAYLEVPEPADASSAIAAAHALSKLALPSHMRPSRYAVVSQLPLTEHGKVDRPTLLAIPTEAPTSAGRAARPGAEETVAQIWAECLEVSEISADADFFELGGNSLDAVTIGGRIEAHFSVKCGLDIVFREPTVERLAAALQFLPSRLPASRILSSPPYRAIRPLPIPLIGPQRSLWMIEEQGLDPPHSYSVPFALRLKGRLDVDTLQRAVDRTVAAHDTLRTSFAWYGDLPHQFVHGAVRVPVEQTVSTRETWLNDALTRIRTPFDIEHAPLLRVCVIYLADDDTDVLLITQHHIITDGSSLRVLVEDLSRDYVESVGHTAPETRTAPHQYRDFLALDHGSLDIEQVERARTFWTETLIGTKRTTLPPDIRTERRGGHHGRRCSARLGPADSDSVRQLRRQLGCTDFALFVALFAVLIAERTGQDEAVIGTTAANRIRPEFQRTLGYFVNLLPLRLAVDLDRSLRDNIDAIMKHLSSALSHQGLPFEEVVAVAGVSDDPAVHPMFSIVFSFEEAAFEKNNTLFGLGFESADIDYGVSRFDLTAYVKSEPDSGFSVSLEYNLELFKEFSIRRMLDDYLALVHLAVRAPADPLRVVLRRRRAETRPATLRQTTMADASVIAGRRA